MKLGSGRICSVCGTVNNENAKFCFECGNKFEEQKVCQKCGRAYEEGMKFCPQCGTSLMNQNVINENTMIGSELMADPIDLEDEELDEENITAFGSSIKRSEINIITISDRMYEVPDDAWDVSSNKDRSVMAYIRNRDDLTELVIAGRNGVRANKNCSCLFAGYQNIKQINFSGKFDTSQVTDMSFMFLSEDYSELTKLDVSGFNTSRVTNMKYMF